MVDLDAGGPVTKNVFVFEPEVEQMSVVAALAVEELDAWKEVELEWVQLLAAELVGMKWRWGD